MIGSTLSLYIATRFAKTVLVMMVSMLFFIVLVDFVEQLRKAAEQPDIPVLGLLQLSALKAPMFMDKAFPFGCLFAAMVTLTQLNQKLELVIARAAGVSAWQFLMPVSAAAILIGLFAALVYNPAAIAATEMSKNLEIALFDRHERSASAETSDYWIRQDDGEGSSVINARIARFGGKLLNDVRILRFNEEGRIYERIDADSARLDGERWLIEDAIVMGGDARSVRHQRYEIETRLKAETLAGVTSDADSVPLWQLRRMAFLASLAGGNPSPYLVQFYNLLALPVLLIAMVVIAATVSLRFVRFGQVGRMILGGILCGFVLYTATNLVVSLGNNGIVPPAFAAWSPPIVAIMLGISILLHQEDG